MNKIKKDGGGTQKSWKTRHNEQLSAQPDSAYSRHAVANPFLSAYSHKSSYIRCDCTVHLQNENEMADDQKFALIWGRGDWHKAHANVGLGAMGLLPPCLTTSGSKLRRARDILEGVCPQRASCAPWQQRGPRVSRGASGDST